MVKLELEIPDELEKEIKEFSEDWSKIALEAIKLKIFELELKRSRKLRHLLFKALISKSKFSEKDALELGRKINESLYKDLKSEGLI